MKRTPWFPVFFKPSRVGEYEYKITDAGRETTVPMEWDGFDWRDDCGFVFPHWPGDQWRGLTKKAT